MRTRVHRLLGRSGDPLEEFARLTEEDRRYLGSLHDESVALPEGASDYLTDGNPRLIELREQYAGLELPVLATSRWQRKWVDAFLDLRYFRGDNLITWHYRELPRVTRLKYFIFARHVADRDPRGYLDRLDEDGAFGCWTFTYPGLGRVSRDLLQSVAELTFLDRRLGLHDHEGLRVLDIGAGYGRLAHRMSAAYPGLADYCCVDAVPESTFVCEYYLGHRHCSPPARVVPLGEVEALRPGAFDLAVNVHSFPEMPLGAIAWWVEQVARLGIPRLVIVPNDPERLVSQEADDTRLDFVPVLREAGYRLEAREPVLDDPAVRELLELDDHFFVFGR